MRGEVPSRNWTKSSCLWYGIYKYTPRNVTAWLPAQYMACLSNSLSATQMMPYEDFALIILWLVFDVLEIGRLSLYSWGRTVLRCCSSVIPLGGSKYLPVCLTFFFWKSLRLSWSRKYKNSVPSALLMTSVLWLKYVDIICFGLSFTFSRKPLATEGPQWQSFQSFTQELSSQNATFSFKKSDAADCWC